MAFLDSQDGGGMLGKDVGEDDRVLGFDEDDGGANVGEPGHLDARDNSR